ncbi:transcription antitermination factor NusB [Streptococcus sp. S784/96/1]|uniref:transcription antitermination factor NusB n=1 Tax=Streptococcus sp. S784/96/1 TaxID=2653499 RepID=UPI001386F934|nr:transcription antitermination factor NusB [Streptococcus sp. S784/96/1]
MTDNFKHSRRDIRERAFQALFSLEFGGNPIQAGENAYRYDKHEGFDQDVPVFLLNLIKGVQDHQTDLDKKIAEYLKKGWSLDRLTLNDKILLRLALYEMQYEDTPDRVVINEIIDIAKKYSDHISAKFINGILTNFIVETD